MSLPGSQFFQLVALRSRAIEQAIATANGSVEVRVQYGANAKLSVEIRTPNHLALLEAWNQARCLDATLLENSSNKSTVLFAGPCATDHEVDERLASLCKELQLDVTFNDAE